MSAPARRIICSGGGSLRRPALVALALLIALSLAPRITLGEEKVVTPVITKTARVISNDGSAAYASDVDATVGEPIAFRLEGTLPSNWDEFSSYRYEFHDQPSEGLDVDHSSVRVSLIGADGSLKKDLTPAFEVNSAGGNSGEWTCRTSDLKAAAPVAVQDDRIVLTYTASLIPAKAKPGASSAQRNLAYLEYTSKPFTDAVGRSKESETAVSTWSLGLAKVDAQDHSRTLAGASLTLQAPDGRYVTASGGLSSAMQELSCDDAGRLDLAGIGSGTYTLTETRAPEGYELPEAPWHITVAYDASGTSPRLLVTIGESGESFEADSESGVISLIVPNAQRGMPVAGLSPVGGTPNTGEGISAPFAVLATLGLVVAAAALLLRPRTGE